ncbi:MAG TPA: extracellular solute-binding protein [Patescibacteria group bacterium]|nr:extracellular solute-binding protein [Patescibacteria group bacterium]
MKKGLIIGGIIIFLLIVILIVVAVVFKKGSDQPTNTSKTAYPSGPVTLTWWYLYDDEAALTPTVQAYKQAHDNATINLVKKNPSGYETELINAIANGSGPDLFQIKNDWLTKHEDKLSPMPEDYMSTDDYKKIFAPVAAQDLIADNRIWGIPFYVDTLGLYYNKTLIGNYNYSVGRQADLSSDQIDKLRIDKVAENWTDLIGQIKKLTAKNGTNIAQSGIALGTSNNVEASQDILSLLMLQNGTKMVSEDKNTPTLNLSIEKSNDQIYYPGTSALDFYTSFAKPAKETYSWNASQATSTEAFIANKTAMMINYSYQIKQIKNSAPDLEYDFAPIPQVKGSDNRINYASYWPNVVSKNSQNSVVAWDFLKFATDKDNMIQYKYLEITGRPTSRLDLVSEYLGDVDISVFKNQISTAQSWYKGQAPNKIDQIFNSMITAVTAKSQPAQKAIDAAVENIKTLWANKETDAP